ncbi:MAG: hypothetical protein K8T89_08160 [Planctomycetes bacterium]|nr:hypothetical protein [Planctomycetota bacterium]
MKHPRIVIYETDGRLAEQIRDVARENGWLVRESRQAEACLALLREGGPAVLIIKLERKLIDEMSLLAKLNEQVPHCPVILISDAKMENALRRSSFAGLAYDLGARYVLFPPLSRSVIEDAVVGLLEAAIHRSTHA